MWFKKNSYFETQLMKTQFLKIQLNIIVKSPENTFFQNLDVNVNFAT